MRPVNTNPDRDFSAAQRPAEEDLRDLLQRSEVADMDDSAIQRRFGELIGRAGVNSYSPATISVTPNAMGAEMPRSSQSRRLTQSVQAWTKA